VKATILNMYIVWNVANFGKRKMSKWREFENEDVIKIKFSL
jgi:hypothetical protein